MNIIFIVIALVMAWTSCSVEWIVSYATSIVQLSVWVTAFSLISFWSLFVDFKNDLSLSTNDQVSWSSLIK